jgi:hypothetical protein
MRGARTEHGPDAGVGEDRVERGREIRAAVADHEADSMRLVAEAHQEVAGLLGCPRSGWMLRDSEDADAPGGVLDHGQDIGLGAVKQLRGEEIARQDRLGQRRIVSGVTSSRSPWRRALGITLSRVASGARSAQVSFGRRG